MSPLTPSAAFARHFRAVAFSDVEYSFDADLDRCGTTVRGADGFVGVVSEFVRSTPFAGEWAWALDRFERRVRPDQFLLRVDWSSGEVAALSLYCRFPQEPSDEEFADAMRSARPHVWEGPRPGALAALLGVAGPRGVGFRVHRSGDLRVSAYFRVDSPVTTLGGDTLARLVATSRLPAELATTIVADLEPIHPVGLVGIVGIDSGSPGHAGALKFNSPDVALTDATSFLSARGTERTALRRLERTSRALRSPSITYFGTRYDVTGLSGWRAYFSTEPAACGGVGAPAVTSINIPARRMPHGHH